MNAVRAGYCHPMWIRFAKPSSNGLGKSSAEGMRITAKAPTRIDFAGGTLDLWPLYLFFDGATTINAAINLFARATLESLPSTKIELISRDQQQSQVAERWEELDPNGTLALLARIVRHF